MSIAPYVSVAALARRASRGTSGPLSRTFGLLALTMAAFAAAGQAQTAPQLYPYTSKLIAGGGTAAIASGATCPQSGYTSTDAYGDGCLATEVQLVAPRYAIADATGAVFISDYTNGLIRRVDPVTGIITAVAGGVTASPSAGSTCGTGKSIDSRGDGCPANLVHLSHPTGLAFDSAGNLAFADYGQYDVRLITATNGLITTTGVISNIAGYAGGASTYGFVISNSSTAINAATQSYLDAPYGIQYDSKGDLYIAEEYKDATLVVNTNAALATTVNGVTIPAGQIVKIAGAATGNNPTCPNGTSGTFGCNYGTYVSGAQANASFLDNNYGVAVDAAGNAYIANEYNQVVARVDGNNVLTNYAGQLSGYGKATTTRAPAGTFGIGSDFGITTDSSSNLYFTDALSGVIWRVDATTGYQYIVAGAATAVCSAATDTYGDGCPATQATYGKTGSTYATASSPGLFGITADAAANLYVGDTITNLVREVSSGTQFGVVGANQPTNTVAIHFAAGDSAASYTLTSGATNFSLGTATCTTNTSTDNTTDCLLPVTATPSTLGVFSGTLKVTSAKGGSASFALSGTYVVTPYTRTAVTVNTGVTCTGSTAISTTTAVKLTATIASSGNPTGTVQFYANGTAIGAAQAVSNSVATLSYTFSTPGTYTITATYSGDSYFKTSTGTSSTTVTTATASFNLATNSGSESTVSAGGTALYSFTLTQTVYTGTLSFACSGLPAYASCSFSPATVVGTGCSASSTVTMNIYTTQPGPIKSTGLAVPLSGRWQLLCLVPGLLLGMAVAVRRRRLPARFAQLGVALVLLAAASGLVACGNGKVTAGTPTGASTVTVNITSSTGTSSTVTVPLTVQ